MRRVAAHGSGSPARAPSPRRYETFLADARVLPILPPLLGKTFFKKRALPTPVNLKKADLKAELTRAACGAAYRHPTGTSNSIQAGTASQKASHLVTNILALAEQVATAKVAKGWAGVQAMHLRSTNTVALPIYAALPHA